MGRKRHPANAKLPPYVYRQKYGVMLGEYDRETKRTTYTRLAPADATVGQIWTAYERRRTAGLRTFTWLAEQYLASPEFTGLADSTKNNYRFAHRAVVGARLRGGGLLGELPLSRWTPGLVRKYCDKRSETAPVRAVREKAYISIVFSWGYARDKAASNPAKGVRVKTPAPKRDYVTDAQYAAFYDLAASPPYIRPAMEIAYLCAARLCEVLDLTVDSIREDGLFLRRRKGSRDAVIEWSPALRAAVDEAKRVRRNQFRPHLFQGSDGERLRETSFQTAWQRLSQAFEREGGVRFGYHRLKAKRVSDATENKQVISGHKSSAMVAVYDLLPLRVRPDR